MRFTHPLLHSWYVVTRVVLCITFVRPKEYSKVFACAKSNRTPDRACNWSCPTVLRRVYPVQPRGQESTSVTPCLARHQAWRNTLTLFLSRLQSSCTDFKSRKTQRIIRPCHRWRARNAGERTRWNATWRPTWNSNAAARGTSCVTCVRLNTRRISVCVVIFYRGTTSTCRRSSRFLSAFLTNKINK